MYSSNVTSYLTHFVPRGTTPLGIEAIDAAAAVHGGVVCVKRCQVSRLLFVLETAVAADSTAPVIEFNRRPTIASNSGEILLGQITIPDGTAIGTVMYKDIDPVTFEVGDELSFELVTQAVDGSSAAGDGYYAVEIQESPEDARNESNMVASA